VRGEPYLVVRLSGQEFLLPTDGVTAMLQLRGQRCLPSRPHGLLRYRFRMNREWVPAGAPHQALGLKPRSLSARSGLILIERSRAGLAPHRFGVIVDSFSRIEQVPTNDLRPARPDSPPDPFTLGQARLHGKWRPVLDLDAIFPPALVLSVTAA
jgi:chemotaxis signal transduction protein